MEDQSKFSTLTLNLFLFSALSERNDILFWIEKFQLDYLIYQHEHGTIVGRIIEDNASMKLKRELIQM